MFAPSIFFSGALLGRTPSTHPSVPPHNVPMFPVCPCPALSALTLSPRVGGDRGSVGSDSGPYFCCGFPFLFLPSPLFCDPPACSGGGGVVRVEWRDRERKNEATKRTGKVQQTRQARDIASPSRPFLHACIRLAVVGGVFASLPPLPLPGARAGLTLVVMMLTL
jgi:hypothetical protein